VNLSLPARLVRLPVAFNSQVRTTRFLAAASFRAFTLAPKENVAGDRSNSKDDGGINNTNVCVALLSAPGHLQQPGNVQSFSRIILRRVIIHFNKMISYCFCSSEQLFRL